MTHSKINGSVIVGAMNQAFFTLSIGIGSMAIFGSYIGKERSLMGESVNIILLPIGAFIFAVFCCYKFGWGWDNFVAEANAGKGMKVREWMKPIFKYFVPICVLALYIYGLCTFGWK